MTFTTILAACALCALAGVLAFAATANLEPDEPAFPPGEHRDRMLLISLACALTFVAGGLL